MGKTDLIQTFHELAGKPDRWRHAVINEIADRPAPSVVESLMELSLVLSRQGFPEMEKSLFDETKCDLSFALEKELQKPVLLILDEALLFFRSKSGAPKSEMDRILACICGTGPLSPGGSRSSWTESLRRPGGPS